MSLGLFGPEVIIPYTVAKSLEADRPVGRSDLTHQQLRLQLEPACGLSGKERAGEGGRMSRQNGSVFALFMPQFHNIFHSFQRVIPRINLIINRK